MRNGTRRKKRVERSFRSSVSGATGRLKKKLESKKKIMKKKLNKRGSSEFSDSFSEALSDENIEVIYEKKPTPLSERSKLLGKESFNMMELASKQGDFLLVERSYVLIVGEDDSELYLLLRSLQHLVNLEREVRPITSYM